MGKRLEVNPGDRYGRLKVIKEISKRYKQRRFLCLCECGNYKDVALSKLRSGNTRSCGCLQKEVRGKSTLTHGLTNNRLYNIWNGIKSRCNNQNNKIYKYYGGRGIRICDEWKHFDDFYKWAINNGYEDDLTIERINVDGDYSPENCIWVTQEHQNRNKRNTVHVTYKDETKTLKEWCKVLNLDYLRTWKRLKRGWTVAEAFEKPTNKRKLSS